MAKVVQLPLPVFQALVGKIGERPFNEVVQLLGAVNAQAKILDMPDAPEEAAQ